MASGNEGAGREASRSAADPAPHAMSAYRLGTWSAGAVTAIGVAYGASLIAGFAQVGFDAPIRDPVLAIMEVLTLISSVAVLMAMAVVHHHAPPERKVFGVLALALTVIFVGLTSVVHFVELTVARQVGTAEISWPSASYAAELLAWDWFLGLALVFAALVFPGAGAERLLKMLLLTAGLLSVVGTVGPLVGDMRLQRIGIVGYAAVLPVAFFLLARYFRAQHLATASWEPDRHVPQASMNFNPKGLGEAAMRRHEKIDYVEYPSRDLVATKLFFERAFGWDFEDYGPDYAAFSDQGLDGGFFTSDLAARTETGSALIVLYSEDLEDTLGKVEAAGGRVIKPIFAFPGGRRFHFAEPGGNELAVWSEPAA